MRTIWSSLWARSSGLPMVAELVTYTGRLPYEDLVDGATILFDADEAENVVAFFSACDELTYEG